MRVKPSLILAGIILFCAFGVVTTAQASGSIILSQASNVVVTFTSEDANCSNTFGVSSPINRTLGTNHGTHEGTQFNIGQIPAGELVLRLEGCGCHLYYTGDVSRNPDHYDHARVTVIGTNQWRIGFEDIYGGGDRDYNDTVLTVTATPVCTDHASKQCVGTSAVYWYNSCGVQQDVYQTCTANQICQNAQCVNVACSTNATCGTSGYVGSQFCQGNDVYQNYTTYTCNNPGTTGSYCSNATAAQKKLTCGANQVCTNGACADVQITCSTNAQCGANAYTGSAFCRDGNVYQNYTTWTCNNPGTSNSYCSNNTAAQKKTDCTANQVCANGSCTDQIITCSSDSACGANGYVGNPFCQSGNVYQNYKTWTCNNAGTAYSYCSNNTSAQKKTDCTANQVCNNGSCNAQQINCSSNSECGTNGYIGSPFCRDGDVYQNYTTWTCNNLGTVNSYCSNDTTAQKKTDCTANQVCANGSCTDQIVTCASNSACGTNGYTGSPYCRDGNVYQNYTTWTCNNPGTAYSYCSNNSLGQKKTDCTANQVCNNGSCTTQQIDCTSNSACGANGYTGSAFCRDGNVYQNYTTYTCNNPGTSSSYCSNDTTAQKKTDCTANQTCSNGSCTTQHIECSSSSDCGANAYTGSAFCQNGDVYQNYKTWTCNNAGTANSYCSENSNSQLKTDCTANQTCSNGSCTTQNITCSSSSDCGTNAYVDSPFCQSGNVYQNYKTWTCNNAGTGSSYCSESTNSQLKTTCTGNQTCSNGSCGNSCTQNSYQRCVGSYLYWYDSCGNQQNNNSQYCQNGCYNNSCGYNNQTNGNLLVNRTVRNLSTGSGFATTTNASPGDMLMFMITLQANGQDVQNVFVRDNLPATLIYNNQLIVSGANNYSGDIISGLNLNTISNGQTVTVTYQVQVAGAANFAYGSTTLNNNVTVTASNNNNIPAGNASVVVTRSAVYGASTINTGLTDNPFVDSFIIPLFIILAGVWAILNAKKKKNSFDAEKELSSRISQIRQAEKGLI